MSKITKDPALYRKLSEPHASREAAETAMDDFNAEVRELREKYRIPEVSVVASANYVDKSGESSLMTMSHSGDSAKGLMLMAQAFGAAKADHLALLDKLIS